MLQWDGKRRCAKGLKEHQYLPKEKHLHPIYYANRAFRAHIQPAKGDQNVYQSIVLFANGDYIACNHRLLRPGYTFTETNLNCCAK